MGKVSEAVAAAQKILGKDGKIPKPRADLAALGTAWTKAGQAFRKSITDLETNLEALEKATTATKDCYKQYADVIQKSNFDLDESDDDAEKKIESARQLILDAIQEGQVVSDKSLDNLGKLDRIVSDLHRLDNLDV